MTDGPYSAGLLARLSEAVYRPVGMLESISAALPSWRLTEYDGESGVYGVLGVAPPDSGMPSVLVVRGTEPHDWRDWMADIDCDLVETPGIEGLVHEGILGQALDLVSMLSRRPAPLLLDLVVTGHSLGGAVATLVGQMVMVTSRVVTFGAPRVGNADWAAGYRGRIERYVHHADVVPRLPLLSMGYRHPRGLLRYIDSGGAIIDNAPWFSRLVDLFRGVDLDGIPDALHDHRAALYRELLQTAGAKRVLR